MHLLDFMLLCIMITKHQINNIKPINSIVISTSMIEFIHKIYIDLVHNANKRNIKINIMPNDIIKKYKLQNGKCALSGLELKNNIKNLNLSVDRINSNLNYDFDNIQLIIDILNKSKFDYSNDDYINFCHTIVHNHNYPMQISQY